MRQRLDRKPQREMLALVVERGPVFLTGTPTLQALERRGLVTTTLNSPNRYRVTATDDGRTVHHAKGGRQLGVAAVELRGEIRNASPVVRQLLTLMDADKRSLSAVAKATGSHVQTFNRWRNGTNGSPRISDMENVGQVLGYRLKWEKIG